MIKKDIRKKRTYGDNQRKLHLLRNEIHFDCEGSGRNILQAFVNDCSGVRHGVCCWSLRRGRRGDDGPETRMCDAKAWQAMHNWRREERCYS